jgi:CheY-like chemotaxis protein
MEEKHEALVHIDVKLDNSLPHGQAWVDQTGCIVDCNDKFSTLVNIPKAKLLRNTYITDLVKFDNPNMLLEAVHELDELFNTPYKDTGRTAWKGTLDKVNADEEHCVIIEKKKEVNKIGHKTVLEAILLPVSELLPQRHASVGHKSLQSKIPPIDVLTEEESKPPAEGKDSVLKVLIVDDSPTALKVMGRMIQRLGHEVVMAVDGLEALDKLRTQTFDIVLMDINMPKMNGLEAAHEFRKIEDERNRFYGTKKKSYLKVVALSGDISNTLFHEVTNAGFDTFIPKPLTVEKFQEVLNMQVNPPQATAGRK